MLKAVARLLLAPLVLFGADLGGASAADSHDFSEPWKRTDRALVIDAYEYNPIDWQKLVDDKRIVGFINKGSDGLSPPYKCSGSETEERLCKALWKRHAVARELFHTRRTIAKALGLKWGAYHLGRPGNPIDQANNFIDFAEPGADDLIALDIEDNDPKKWMSLSDAESFARHIYARLGRWPVLYTNGSTALHIAENRDRYRVLSRLPLWYARYKPAIGLHFPKGNWQSYALWQFSAGTNCDSRSCPYRVPGTPLDIDVNVASMNATELRAAWPFSHLVDEIDHPPRETVAETVPLPVSRRAALEGGDITVQFAEVAEGDMPPIEDVPAVATLEAGVPPNEEAPVDVAAAARRAEPMRSEIADVIIATGETVPLPVWRSEAKKKRGDVTLKFVAVEQAVARAAVLPAGGRSRPFQALLGKDAEAKLPVELVGFAEVERAHVGAKIAIIAETVASPATIQSQPISAAALDDPGPLVSTISRRDLPVFLLRKLDGPDETAP